MNEEEFEECSVVPYPHEIRFLHIKGGRISYYVDRHISDYVNKIQQENQELKKQLEEYKKWYQDELEEKCELAEENQKLKEMQCTFLGTGCQNKMKYILIWYYHDTNIEYCDTKEELLIMLENLKLEYKNDSDFTYTIYYGRILEK